MEIWHNPRCSKSRIAKAALDDAGVDYVERRYLDEPPTFDELDALLDRLGLEPWDITRTGEKVAQELGVAALPRERKTWIELLVANPVLIQRPIIISGDRAAVARDAESLRDILP